MVNPSDPQKATVLCKRGIVISLFRLQNTGPRAQALESGELQAQIVALSSNVSEPQFPQLKLRYTVIVHTFQGCCKTLQRGYLDSFLWPGI